MLSKWMVNKERIDARKVLKILLDDYVSKRLEEIVRKSKEKRPDLEKTSKFKSKSPKSSGKLSIVPRLNLSGIIK